MKYTYDRRINLHVEGRISAADAERQERTAREILKRLENLPGVILADEVGMGKTFVALAVAATVAVSQSKDGPVVIMVPPSLRDKWPRDFSLFRERCLPEQLRRKLMAGRAERAVEFLKLLDDPPERKKSIIFLTHGAMYRGLIDRWVQLAMIQRALHRRRNVDDVRESLYRNTGELLGLKWAQRRDPEIWRKLLAKPTDRWLKILTRSGIDPERDDNPETDDDPVPEMIREALEDMDLSELFEQLENDLPRRRTKHFDDHMRNCRRALRRTMRSLWQNCVRKLDYRLPLLVLDEAHHLKNPSTQLASLFHDKRAAEDANIVSRGPFAGVFERMLFLTATPFQLGHHELCSVLNRFSGIAWRSKNAPAGGLRRFQTEIASLASRLDRAQEAAVRLEGAWGRLKTGGEGPDSATPADVRAWWKSVVDRTDSRSPTVANILHRYERARQALKNAESELKPWIVRHNRTRVIPGTDGRTTRRSYRVGAHIAGDDDTVSISINRRGDWYLKQLETLIPRGNIEESRTHPKISAVVDKAIELWRRREKVLVFCHYIATGRILRQHVSNAIRESIIEEGARSLGVAKKKVLDRLDQLGNRFFDSDSPAKRACDEAVLDILDSYDELSPWQDEIAGIVRRYVRTPSFLVRYFPLGQSTIDEQVMRTVLDTRDGSGMSFRELIVSFFDFLSTNCTDDERDEYLQALDSIQTGSISGRDVNASFDESELQENQISRELLMPNVRLVNGATRKNTRRTLMLTFNTPFFPEILIASSVMAEGVDLHLNCRYVIHHDLCWNPSTLEQRNGRVDRIGGKVERAKAPIHIYLPYVSQTQDEKMYRVVRDRERWFKVVMGEKMTLDAKTTDKIAERVPLPESVAEELSFDLRVE